MVTVFCSFDYCLGSVSVDSISSLDLNNSLGFPLVITSRHRQGVDSTDPLSTQYRSGDSSPALPRRDERGRRKQSSNRSWGLVLVLSTIYHVCVCCPKSTGPQDCAVSLRLYFFFCAFSPPGCLLVQRFRHRRYRLFSSNRLVTAVSTRTICAFYWFPSRF